MYYSIVVGGGVDELIEVKVVPKKICGLAS